MISNAAIQLQASTPVTLPTLNQREAVTISPQVQSLILYHLREFNFPIHPQASVLDIESVTKYFFEENQALTTLEKIEKLMQTIDKLHEHVIFLKRNGSELSSVKATQVFLYDVTKKVANECTDSTDRLVALEEISRNEARQGFYTEGLQTALSMSPTTKTEQMLKHAAVSIIIGTQARKNPDDALAAIQSFDMDLKVECLHAIAVAQTHLKCERALETANLIPATPKYIKDRDQCFSMVSYQLIFQKCFVLAGQAAGSISDPDKRLQATKKIIEFVDHFGSQK